MQRKRKLIFAAILGLLGLPSAYAQHTAPGSDAATEAMSGRSDGAGDSGKASGAARADTMSMGSMQGGSPPAAARSPDYSDGYGFGDIPPPVLADKRNFSMVLLDRLERVKSSNNASAFYDLQAWFGRDYDRAVLKAEGSVDSNKLEDATTELLWGHAIATYWDTQLGVRYDNGDGPDRGWLAFGVQGLAPYWFEVDTTAYVGTGGRTTANLEADYDLLLSQKLILQPRFEADWYGKRDRARGLGSGLTEIKAGLRLRYELRREFAPYLGVEWLRKLGDTGDLARAAGLETSEARFVAGLRAWF